MDSKLPMSITITDKWVPPKRQVTKISHSRIMLSKPQPILHRGVDMQIGLVTNHPDVEVDDYIYAFCQFSGCALEKFTVQVYMKLLQIKSQNIMFRCDIQKGFQRTAMYPLIKRPAVNEYLKRKFTSFVLSYEVCVFVTLRDRFVRLPEKYPIERQVLNTKPLMESDLGAGTVSQRELPENMEILQKYLLYKIVPTLNQTTEDLIGLARGRGMNEFVDICTQMLKIKKQRIVAAVANEICHKVAPSVPNCLDLIQLPAPEELTGIILLNATVPSSSHTNVHGTYNAYDRVFHPLSSPIAAAVATPDGDSSSEDSSLSTVGASQPEPRMFDFSSHIYGITAPF